MDQLSSLVSKAYDLGMTVIIEDDFNLSLDIGDRGQIFQDMCSLFDVEFVNHVGYAADEDQNTFQSSIVIRRRIDFIMYSEHLSDSR